MYKAKLRSSLPFEVISENKTGFKIFHSQDKTEFGDLAGEYSDCPSSNEGGSLGSFGRGAMVPEFETAAFALDVNGISDVIETSFGFHLIKRTG